MEDKQKELLAANHAAAKDVLLSLSLSLSICAPCSITTSSGKRHVISSN